MNSDDDRTLARVARRAFRAQATWVLGTMTLSSALGCASTNVGAGGREPELAGTARGAGSSVRVAAPSPAATQPLAVDTTSLAREERMPAPPDRCEPLRIARPEGAAIARQGVLDGASSFAAIGVLTALYPNDSKAPIGAWGTTLDAAYQVGEVTRLFGAVTDDTLDFGELAIFGLDRAASGPSGALGPNGPTPSRTAWMTAAEGRASMQSRDTTSIAR